jgi:hypothetical protein
LPYERSSAKAGRKQQGTPGGKREKKIDKKRNSEKRKDGSWRWLNKI